MATPFEPQPDELTGLLTFIDGLCGRPPIRKRSSASIPATRSSSTSEELARHADIIRESIDGLKGV